MACDYETEFRCGDGEYNLHKKILGRLAQLVGLAGGGGGVGDTVTLTVSDIEIGAVEIKDGDTDARAMVITTCPVDSDRGLVVRNIPCGTQAVSGPFLTDAQLRASAIVVTGPLTDAQLRASAVAVSMASLPLPAGAATEVTLADIAVNIADIDSLIMTTCPSGSDPALAVRNIPCGTQAISAVSLPLPAGAATEVTLANIDAYTSFYLGHLEFIDFQTSSMQSDMTAILARTPTLGQKTMAGSSPVVIASDQSVIPVTGPLTDAQLRATAVPVSGPLTDAQLRATPVSITHAFAATYGSFTAELTLGTAIGKNRILSFFHPIGVTLNYEIVKIILFFKTTHTVGVGQYKIQFSTVESATGTVLTPQQYHRGDANTGASVRSATTADGTLVGNPFIGYTKSLTPITGDPLGAMVPIYEHPGSPEEKPITLRASTAEGILVFQDVTATLTTAPIVAARIVWREKL